MNVIVEFPELFLVGFLIGGLCWIPGMKWAAIRGALNAAISD